MEKGQMPPLKREGKKGRPEFILIESFEAQGRRDGAFEEVLELLPS